MREFLGRVLGAYREHLGDELVAVWLVGSLALGCYNRALSDLDLLVVVERAPDLRALSRDCVALTDTRSVPGDQETTVVLRKVLKPLLHPTPHLFRYSASWTDTFRTTGFLPHEENSDPDIVVHAAVALRCGISLFGRKPAEILGPVSWPDYIASLRDDLDWIVAAGSLAKAPIYGVLNGCRILMALTEGEGTVASKLEGADWALRHFPAAHRPLVKQALDAYVETVEVAPDERLTAGLRWDPAALRAFAAYARERVARRWPSSRSDVRASS